MAWIESHQSLREHPKLHNLSRLLNTEPVHLVGHLHFLWWWCIEYAMDGNITKYTPKQIAKAADWPGDSDAFLDALVEVGLVDRRADTLKIHDWLDFCGDMVLKRLERINDKRIRANNVVSQVAAERSPNGALPTLPTVPTIPYVKAAKTDIQKVVLTYKIVSGYDKEDKLWDKINFARCTKTAKSLIEFVGGDWHMAADCIQDIYEKLNSKGFTVTIETVLKHAAEWKKNRQERSATV